MEETNFLLENFRSFLLIGVLSLEIATISWYNRRKKQTLDTFLHRRVEKFSVQEGFGSVSFLKQFFFPSKASYVAPLTLPSEEQKTKKERRKRLTAIASAGMVVGLTALDISSSVLPVVSGALVFALQVVGLMGYNVSARDMTDMYITDVGIFPAGGTKSYLWEQITRIHFDNDIGQMYYKLTLQAQGLPDLTLLCPRQRIDLLQVMLTEVAEDIQAPCTISRGTTILYAPKAT